MPYYPKKQAVRRGIDLAWGKKQITASVTSGIIQGKSVGKIANDLQKRINTMNRSSALRSARTAVTGAQNAGRMDSYAAAEKMGVKLQKEWVATLDGRTRHSHAMLDGDRVDTGKKFSNGCRFPGDPSGPSWEVYNCRCTMIAAVSGVDTTAAERRAKSHETGKNAVVSGMTFKEWESGKRHGV
jgi:SPP1 gp7 family putative phage head morphogenesis protein